MRKCSNAQNAKCQMPNANLIGIRLNDEAKVLRHVGHIVIAVRKCPCICIDPLVVVVPFVTTKHHPIAITLSIVCDVTRLWLCGGCCCCRCVAVAIPKATVVVPVVPEWRLVFKW